MKTYVLGCGNILKGDDGFGPRVIQYLEKYYVSKSTVHLIDAGLACGEMLFPFYLGEEGLDQLIVVDTYNLNKSPGTIAELSIQDIDLPDSTYSSHYFPGKTLFEKLVESGTILLFIVCQPQVVPEDLSEEISKTISASIKKCSQMIANMLDLEEKTQS